MIVLLWGLTIGTLGKVLLGITVLLVHSRISEEKRIDKIVLASLQREKIIGIASVVFIIIGYILEILFYTGGGI